MKRLILTTIVALFAMVATQAQTAPEVVVRLKSGNEVRGMLIERDAEGVVTIRTAEGDTFVYGKMDYSRIREVEDPQAKAQLKEELDQLKLAEKESAKQLSIQAKDEKREMLEERALGKFRGYRGIAEVSGGFANVVSGSDSSGGGFFANYINGYNFGSCFYAGVGVGLGYKGCNEYDYDSYYSAISIPVFLYLRSAFMRYRKVSPYFSLSAGITIDIESEYGACVGPHIEPTIGAEFRLNKTQALSVGFTFIAAYELISPGLKVGFSF